MGRHWTRRALLAVALAAVPALAAPFPHHRIVAIGDLHGDFSAWRDIARAAKLVDADGRWTGGDTVLVQTGDVVDRGPDSLRIVQDLMRLQSEAQRAHGQVIALIGNHEAMNVTGDFRYVSVGDYAAYTDNRSERRRENVYESNKKLIESAYRQRDPKMDGDAIKQAWLQATPLGSIEHRVAWAPKGAIGRWIVENPAIILMDGSIFVHGGISPAYARMPIEEMNRQVKAALLAGATDPKSIINAEQGPLWYRGLATPEADAGDGTSKTPQPAGQAQPPVAEQLQSLLSAFGAKRIVIGHTPVLSGIAAQYDGRLIRIDTGISRVYGGTVSYLEIIDGVPIPHAVERSQPILK